MPRLSFRLVRTVEEMLPFHSIVIQMPYTFDSDTYRQYLTEMISKGYHQMVVMEGDNCLALAGFWINTKLYCGRYVELDNVIVVPGHQNRGLGKMLCHEIEAEAKAQGCNTALLDAYVENNKAHRFYFREGYRIRGYHFLKEL